MKKLLLNTLLVFAFTTTSLNAEDTKKTNEELVAEFMRIDEERKKEEKKLVEAKAKTKAIKREIKSAIKVNEKLDELIGILSKDK